MSRRGILTIVALMATVAFAPLAWSDENGISFWLPGQYGSFAATPVTPGVTWTTVYYHTTVDAGGGQQFPRGGEISVGLDGNADLVLFGPSYAFATPVFGAQLSVALIAVGGSNKASVDATLTGPGGGMISGRRTDSLFDFGDLYPTATLKWNHGVSNFMAYVTGDIPVGAYDPKRLANLGIGHGAIDAGGAYTYFNPAAGREVSVTIGFTYNFENTHTDYQNGIDMHIDWGAAQFLNKQFFVGAVGYYYQQLTGDSGSGAVLGNFESRVAAVGPQLGYLFPIGDKLQGAINAKAYWEFAAKNRPEGWNAWVALAISRAPAAP